MFVPQMAVVFVPLRGPGAFVLAGPFPTKRVGSRHLGREEDDGGWIWVRRVMVYPLRNIVNLYRIDQHQSAAHHKDNRVIHRSESSTEF